jgi:hypothetical protein
MIKKKGLINIYDDGADTNKLLDDVDTLPNGEYSYYILDNKKNRALPQLKYLFGVVLKTISDKLDEHPSVDALYRYYEQKFAPTQCCIIDGAKFEYFDLKNTKAIEMNEVIEKIIHHATSQWGIVIPTLEEMKEAEAKEGYIGAYTEMWKNYFNQ